MKFAVFFPLLGQGAFLESDFFMTATVMRCTKIEIVRMVSQRMRLVSQRICPKSNSVLTLLQALCRKAKEEAGKWGRRGAK